MSIQFNLIKKKKNKNVSSSIQLIEFTNEHIGEFGSATRSVQQSIEQSEANIRWVEANHATIQDWLKRYTA